MCKPLELFSSVDSSCHESFNGSRIRKNSQDRLQLKNRANVVLSGDDKYAIEPCPLTSFRYPAPGVRQNYNNLLRKERVKIEPCFDQLKRRFPILQ